MKRARRKEKKRKKQQRGERLHRALRYALGALLLLVFMNGIFGENGYLAMRRARADVDRIRKELQQLNEENRQLAGDIHGLKSDPAAIERVAREEMGLARPGELVFRLPENPTNDPGSAKAHPPN